MDIARAMGGATPAVRAFGETVRGLKQRKALELQQNLNALELKEKVDEYRRGQIELPIDVQINTTFEGGIKSPHGQWVFQALKNSGRMTPAGGIKKEDWDLFMNELSTNPYLKSTFLSKKAQGSLMKYREFKAAKEDPKAKSELMKKYDIKGDEQFAQAFEMVTRAYQKDFANEQGAIKSLEELEKEAEKEQIEAEMKRLEFEKEQEELEKLRRGDDKAIYPKGFNQMLGKLQKIQSQIARLESGMSEFGVQFEMTENVKQALGRLKKIEKQQQKFIKKRYPNEWVDYSSKTNKTTTEPTTKPTTNFSELWD